MTLHLEDDQMCYVCGKKNTQGLKLSFEKSRKHHLISEVTFRKEHQGYKNIVHGGMMAAVLDDIMVNLAWLEGLPVMTGELTVRLKKAVPTGHRVLLEGVLERGEGRLVYMRASAKSLKGELYATAKAKCLRVPPGSIKLASRPKEG